MIGTDRWHGGVPTDRHLKFGYCRRAYAMAPVGIGRWHNATAAAVVFTLVGSNARLATNATTNSVSATALVVSSTSNFLISTLSLSVYTGTPATLSVTDNIGNTWVVDSTKILLNTASCAIARCQSPLSAGSTTVTWHYTGLTVAPTNAIPAVYEFSGQAASPVDSVPAGTTGTSATPATPNAAQSVGNELIIGVEGNNSGIASSGLTAGWTLASTIRASGTAAFLIATDALSHGFSVTNAAVPTWVGCAVSYKHA